jgi:hypothetical protein
MPFTVSEEERDHRIRVRRRVSYHKVSTAEDEHIIAGARRRRGLSHSLSRHHCGEGRTPRQRILALPILRPLRLVSLNCFLQRSIVMSCPSWMIGQRLGPEDTGKISGRKSELTLHPAFC